MIAFVVVYTLAAVVSLLVCDVLERLGVIDWIATRLPGGRSW